MGKFLSMLHQDKLMMLIINTPLAARWCWQLISAKSGGLAYFFTDPFDCKVVVRYSRCKFAIDCADNIFYQIIFHESIHSVQFTLTSPFRKSTHSLPQVISKFIYSQHTPLTIDLNSVAFSIFKNIQLVQFAKKLKVN